jgi:RNA polymerase sigma-70 factor (ECF subfamily)
MAIDTQEIWHTFSERLRHFILKRVQNEEDAADILQDVFCKIHGNIDHLRNEDKLQSWLYRIARNAIVDSYRRRKSERRVELGLDRLSDLSTDSDAMTAEIAECLRPMADRLPEKYRQAVLLVDFEGVSQMELADQTGLSLSGAKSRVQRGRQKLKEKLLECCHFELGRSGNILDYHPKAAGCPSCTQ